MEYKRLDKAVMLRLDPGDEVVESIKQVCLAENIVLGTITGLGAVGEVNVGLFDPKEKKYYGNTFIGDYEIVSLVGNITTMDDDVYLHCHMAVGDIKGTVVGGHLQSAVVSATAEIVLTELPGAVGRRFDETIGLNLLAF